MGIPLILGTSKGAFVSLGSEIMKIIGVSEIGTVISVISLQDGTLYLGTNNGFFRWKNEKLEKIADKYEIGVVNSVVQAPDGSLFLGTYYGLYEFKDGKIKAIMSEESELGTMETFALAMAPDGTLYIGTHYKGLFSYKDGHLVKLFDENVIGGPILSLYVASDGTLYIGIDTLEGDTQYSILTLKDGALEVFAYKDITSAVASIAGSPDGSIIYVGAKKGFFMTIDGVLEKLVPYMSTGDVEVVFVSKDGTVYFGGEGGLFEFRDNIINHLLYSNKTGYVFDIDEINNKPLLIRFSLYKLYP